MHFVGATIFGLIFSFRALALGPDWSEGARVPLEGRGRPYDVSESEWQADNQAGRLHAQIYPVTVTGSLPPYEPVRDLIENRERGFFRRWISGFVRGVSRLHSFDDVSSMLGLHPYPLESDTGVYSVPYPDGIRPESRMGLSLITRNGATGFTFSCAACHSSRLFGKTVLGMTNRFPRANEFFIQGKIGISALPSAVFQKVTRADRDEMRLYAETKRNIQFVDVKKPIAVGLDTSLAQVALSLNLRAPTAWAEKNKMGWPEGNDWLDSNPADSKPAVWWNVKYKNRWLSDGSVVSGNPIYTNILWNEIGRGVDLRVLATWLQDNEKIIQELTTAVFSSEAPLYTDFFPAEYINLPRAQQGQKLFSNSCSKCHGQYLKNWDLLPVSSPLVERLKTYKVQYRSRTPVVDVGTDSHRRLGMKSLEKLNGLAIAQQNNILIRPQEGYVAPPLVGIWARWPYFHNNSAPSLCAVLTRGHQRPKVYWARPAEDRNTDFDLECNGYPSNLPNSLKVSEFKFDSNKKGLGNLGHDEGIFLKDGRELFSLEDKANLIEFLKTL